MSQMKQIEILSLDSTQGGQAQFFTPQVCDESMLVNLPAGLMDDLFVHRFQTDQLMVVRGRIVLVILSGGQYRYIPMDEDNPEVVKIPPGVPHGVINLSQAPCLLVNAVVRHGEAHPKDYRPMKRPFPYDLKAACWAIEQSRSVAA